MVVELQLGRSLRHDKSLDGAKPRQNDALVEKWRQRSHDSSLKVYGTVRLYVRRCMLVLTSSDH